MSRNCSYLHEREVRGHLDHLGYLRTYHCTQLAGKSMRQGMFRPSTVCVAAANVCTTPVNTCFVPRFHDRRDHGLVSDVRTLIGSVNGGRIPGAPCRPPVPRPPYRKTKLISQTTQIPKTLDLLLPLPSLHRNSQAPCFNPGEFFMQKMAGSLVEVHIRRETTVQIMPQSGRNSSAL